MSTSRPPVFAIVLLAILAGGFVLIIVDAVASALRTADTVVSVAQQPQEQRQTFEEFADHPMVADRPMPDVECVLPEFSRESAGLQAYYEVLVRCLEQAWRPMLSAAGVQSRLPAMNMDNDPGQTPCGALDPDSLFTAWYCAGDETMYLPLERMTEWDGGKPYLHLGLVAHEYAHHVQQQGGLLEPAYQRMVDVGMETPQGREISRRLELQANCFAGLFLGAIADNGSVTRLETSTAVDGYRYAGLSPTHGDVTAQTRWISHGYSKGNLSACDTWAAPADQVEG